MAADIFGQGVERKISAMFERVLEDGSEQRVVTGQDGPMPLPFLDVFALLVHQFDIDQSVGRICRCLDQDEGYPPLRHRGLGGVADRDLIEAVGKSDRILRLASVFRRSVSVPP
jgi:hypothetical protein